MASINTVILAGNLTRDPESRQVGSSGIVCRLGLAVNRRYRDRNNEMREETTFVDVETWGRQAETCDRYLRKGAPVLIEGRLKLDQWEDKSSGQRRSRLTVVGDRVHFLGRSGGSESYGQDSGYSSNQGNDTAREQRPDTAREQRPDTAREQHPDTAREQRPDNDRRSSNPSPPPFQKRDGEGFQSDDTNAFDVDQDNDESIDDIPF